MRKGNSPWPADFGGNGLVSGFLTAYGDGVGSEADVHLARILGTASEYYSGSTDELSSEPQSVRFSPVFPKDGTLGYSAGRNEYTGTGQSADVHEWFSK